MKSMKYIVSSEKNLKAKYGSKFKRIQSALNALITSDKKKNMDTRILYIDNAQSAKKAGIKTAKSSSPIECKRAIDNLYKAKRPEYIAILGSQDIIPFQEIDNPAGDDGDWIVYSDLPYACDTPYGKDISAFTGPTRVVGRIPDIPGVNDVTYLQRLIRNVIQHKPIKADHYQKYFSVSAKVWQKSTKLSLNSMFGHNIDLLLSPEAAPKNGYKKTQLKPLTHFINCHGASQDWRYYGQHGENYPIALDSVNLAKNIGYGTIVAAECCYGAELLDPTINGNGLNGKQKLSIANAYLANDAIAFVGSSTIAYGPPDSQGLADLITQFFIKNVLSGMSAGRALLDARQRFISVSGPELDPYELKTLAQFYLLGDPSVRPVLPEEVKSLNLKVGNTTRNDRKRMMMKGNSLHENTAPSRKIADKSSLSKNKAIKKLLNDVNLKVVDRAMTFQVQPSPGISGLQKKILGEGAKFHTFVRLKKTSARSNGKETSKGKSAEIYRNYVLVVKEDRHEILGWRVYVAR